MIKISKKIVLILLSCAFMISLNSCAIHDIVQIVKYNRKVNKNLPDTFRLELPIRIDPTGYFCIQGRINDQYDMDFLIDTGALGAGFIRSDTLKRLGATYWNTFPLSTRDVYGHKTKTALYHFNQFSIGSIPFGQPLFMEIKQEDSYIHKIMYKSVLGPWILHNLNWKFSIDDEKITMFSKTDYQSRLNETVGYTRIKGGAFGKNNKLTFPLIKKTEKFTFDLGFTGEIVVNKKIFKQLSQQMPYRKFIGEKGGNIYIFENVDLLWNGVSVPNCEILYNPTAKLSNLIGNKLMRRFNFVLAYGASDSTHLFPSYNDLYIQPTKEFDNTKIEPLISDFGFYTNKKEEKLIVNAIEIGGLAEKAGLMLKDEIIAIDGGEFDLNDEFVEVNLCKYLTGKDNVVIDVKREETLMKIYLSTTK